jgi:CheY-like chemotaxis protein
LATILIVDDEPVLLQLLEQVLTDAGYQVATESDGVQVVSRVWSERPDLVILDLFLGQTGGLDLIKTLRNDPVTRDTRLVLCTGATREVEEQQEWLNALSVPVLNKPFDLDDLLELVSSQIGPP